METFAAATPLAFLHTPKEKTTALPAAGVSGCSGAASQAALHGSTCWHSSRRTRPAVWV